MRALLLVLLLWPGLAAAGAWPRPAGEVYLSTGQEFGPDGWSGLYAEVGGPRALTFGLDAGGHVASGLQAYRTGLTAAPEVDGRLTAFVRIPLRPAVLAERYPSWVAALEFGLGADWETGSDADGATLDLAPRGRVGLSVGRGFSTRWGDGWVNVDARVEPGGAATRAGLGVVTGIRPRERLTVEMGLFAEREGDASTVTLAPTVQYAVPRLGDVRLGVSVGTGGDARLRLGLSRTFQLRPRGGG